MRLDPKERSLVRVLQGTDLRYQAFGLGLRGIDMAGPASLPQYDSPRGDINNKASLAAGLHFSFSP